MSIVADPNPEPQPAAAGEDFIQRAADLVRTSTGRLRFTRSALADLLEAAEQVADDQTHTLVEYGDGESECHDECTACAVQGAAFLLAEQILGGGR